MRNYSNILNMEPTELLRWLSSEFSVEMPEEILTIEDMNLAAKLLMKLSSYYSFLSLLLSYAKLSTRAAKRNGTKEEYEDMVDRKEIIQNMTESVKQQYAAISRSVTIRIENNQELRMGANGT